MKNTDLAYIAGLFDGDGSFSLCKKKADKEGRSSLYYPRIQFGNCNYDLVAYIKSVFGGYLHTKKSHVGKDGSPRKTFYSLKIEKNKNCLPFLEVIKDLLVLKKERALHLLEYIKNNPFKRGSNKLTSEVLMNREKMYLKMKELNKSSNVSGTLKSLNDRRMSKDEMFWSYIAGLMDTDGSFSIKKEKRGPYSPAVLLSMVDCRSIYYLLNNCSVGRVVIIKSKTTTSGFCYRFGIYNKKDVIIFLNQVIPYLKLKEKSALILLEFCEGYVAQMGQYLKTQEQQDFREDCYKRLIEANYGVYKSSLIDLKISAGNAGDNKAEAGDKPGTVNEASGKTSKEDAVL